jgi:hypothetical protein
MKLPDCPTFVLDAALAVKAPQDPFIFIGVVELLGGVRLMVSTMVQMTPGFPGMSFDTRRPPLQARREYGVGFGCRVD